MIDAAGKVHIYDFKTKKVKYLVERNAITGEEEVNVDKALYGLAMREFPIGNRPGTAEKFRELPNRTTYDTWMLQLDVYENILKQSDIPVANKTIAALMYQIDDDNKSYKGQVLHVFEDQDYYDQARSVKLNTDGQWFNDVDATSEVTFAFKRAVNIELPVVS